MTDDALQKLVDCLGMKDIPTGSELVEAIVLYQAVNNLREDGELLSVTSRHLDVPRVCGVADRLQRGKPRCRWDDPMRPLPITLRIVDDFLGLTHDQATRSFQDSLDQWASVCGIAPRIVSPNEDAMITVTTTERESIDGPGGTLAWSELPCGPDRPLTQKYDNAERFVVGRSTHGRISLDLTGLHELGHALGLEHGGDNVMKPHYDPKAELGGYDIDEAVTRYKQPFRPEPLPPEQLAAVTVRLGDATYAGEIPAT